MQNDEDRRTSQRTLAQACKVSKWRRFGRTSYESRSQLWVSGFYFGLYSMLMRGLIGDRWTSYSSGCSSGRFGGHRRDEPMSSRFRILAAKNSRNFVAAFSSGFARIAGTVCA